MPVSGPILMLGTGNPVPSPLRFGPEAVPGSTRTTGPMVQQGWRPFSPDGPLRCVAGPDGRRRGTGDNMRIVPACRGVLLALVRIVYGAGRRWVSTAPIPVGIQPRARGSPTPCAGLSGPAACRAVDRLSA